MQPDPFGRNGALMIVLALAAVSLYVALLATDRDALGDQLRLEHRRRRELEKRLQEKDSQLDGALERIHDLRNGDDEPSPS
ncbi:MAG TPA: hypothetical protein VG325_14480 [Solirubrobacteraceae bacterium]|jgi:hypothetical protein|nr:hypothetical protein [Solirubrobacteraceae bacterium]